MPAIIVVGAQWGDEGKGKVVDCLGGNADMGYRWSGGPQAGHTVHNQYGEITLRTIPAVIFNPDAVCIIGRGVVIDFESLAEEIKKLAALGVSVENRLKISPAANIIMPWQIAEEKVKEAGEINIGTTGKGIGTCQRDKVGRWDALLIHDCIDKTAFLHKLWGLYKAKRGYFLRLYGNSIALPPFDSIKQSMLEGREYMLAYMDDTIRLIRKAMREKKRVILEGAQGTLLDLDDGTFPFVTSTHTTSMAACKLAGISPSDVESVILVVKAYPTRVGNGPFPTELPEDLNSRLRELGHEYGSITGRLRRCGWPDLLIVKNACIVNDIGRPTEIALTKIDVLFKLEQIKVATGYEGADEIGEMERLGFGKMRPIYGEEFSGCKGIENVHCREELPGEARRFVSMVQNYTQSTVRFISTGPRRKDIIAI